MGSSSKCYGGTVDMSFRREVVVNKYFEAKKPVQIAEYEGYSPRDFGGSPEVIKKEDGVNIKFLIEHVGETIYEKFLLCRTIVPSTKRVGIETVVEDPEGQLALPLFIYNYSVNVSRRGNTNMDFVLPLGMYLIIKAPWVKKMKNGTGLVALRVDNPSDIELISPQKIKEIFGDVLWRGARLPNVGRSPYFWEYMQGEKPSLKAEKIRQIAVQSLEEDRLSDAIRWINLSLECYSPGDGWFKWQVLETKAEALRRLGCYRKALEIVEEMLSVNQLQVEIWKMKIKILMATKKPKEAQRQVDAVLKKFPKTLSELSVIKIPKPFTPPDRALINSILNMNPGDIDYPDLDFFPQFTGPVEIAEVAKMGKCLFATKDIKKGEIIIATKAFAHYRPQRGGMEDPPVRLVQGYEFLTKPAHDKVLNIVANKIFFEPEIGRELYTTLWTGEDGVKSRRLNEKEERKVSMFRINLMLLHNALPDHATYGQGDKKNKGCTLAMLPSAINHSCSDANAVFWVMAGGNVVLVLAAKDIGKGKEILVSYVDPRLPYDDRLKMFYKTDFKCQCRLCKIQSKKKGDGKAAAAKILEEDLVFPEMLLEYYS